MISKSRSKPFSDKINKPVIIEGQDILSHSEKYIWKEFCRFNKQNDNFNTRNGFSANDLQLFFHHISKSNNFKVKSIQTQMKNLGYACFEKTGIDIWENFSVVMIWHSYFLAPIKHMSLVSHQNVIFITLMF